MRILFGILLIVLLVGPSFSGTTTPDSRIHICTGQANEIPGATCVPAAVIENIRQQRCRGEGEDIEGKEQGLGSQCCEGLTAIAASSLEQGRCVSGPASIQICTRCGDNICGKGENSCNCTKDCGVDRP
ncbi:hypothetical protein [Methylomonas sp. AM2-LC]|uniref:hypothetical protein n=1 Tax=Methylomonas sp. AM2-LC TaxID=3153301 RepID=UPI0032644F97